MNIIENIFYNDGYWCTNCEKYYELLPEESETCKNNIIDYTLNYDKMIKFLTDFYIDEDIARMYVFNHLNYKHEQIDCFFKIILNDNKKDMDYDNLYELVKKRYWYEVSDKNIIVCENNKFVKCSKKRIYYAEFHRRLWKALDYMKLFNPFY
jgi:hypothetical protein